MSETPARGVTALSEGEREALDAILVALWQCETEAGYEHTAAKVMSTVEGILAARLVDTTQALGSMLLQKAATGFGERGPLDRYHAAVWSCGAWLREGDALRELAEARAALAAVTTALDVGGVGEWTAAGAGLGHVCGRDMDPGCDGCVVVAGDSGGEF